MRVTHFLICTIAAGAAAIAASGYVAYTQLSALSLVRETRDLVAASESISQVIERAAIERGTVTQSLLAADPDGKFAAANAAAAAQTDERIGQMQRNFARTSFADRPETAASVRDIGERIAEARRLARFDHRKGGLSDA